VEKLNKTKYLPPNLLNEIFIKKRIFPRLEVIGYSAQGKSIYSLKIGHGNKKVLMWSQMHGNETTSTKSLIDFYDFLVNDEIGKYLKTNLTFKIIFQLNPDGSHAYSRNNFNDSDLNRDALSLIQPESKVLMKEFYLFKPNFCFNLHGQRSIYSIGNNNIPASISFLAPCASKNKTITKSRLLSMQLITGVCNFLKSKYGLVYGRFDDSFNLNCFGDFFSRQKVPTILFEAGHYKNDIFRKFSRKLVFDSLVEICLLISSESYIEIDHKKYFKIIPNNNNLRDILIKNVTILKNNKIITGQEISIQHTEKLVNNEVLFLPIIDSISSKLNFNSLNVFELTNDKSINNILDVSIGDNAEKFLKKVNLLNNI
tara:strand:- start:198 stop:1307 length:1110 start_codon:yes stop_codon:yes gene_type:complete